MASPGAESFIPLTEDQERRAFDSLGETKALLYKSVPVAIRLREGLSLPPALCELELTRHATELAARNTTTASAVSFLGAGSYDHFIPAAVDAIASRGEFLTAYTPYQAEASQGSLIASFEYQSMMCELTGGEVSNAGVYDGATAMAEAVLMARRVRRKGRAVVVSGAVHPEYLDVLRTYLSFTDIEVRVASLEGGATSAAEVARLSEGAFAVVAANPNFFGCIERLGELFEAGRAGGALGIAVVNPITLGVLEAPGRLEADIVCGDGQPLGCPQYFGGPAFGFMVTRKEFVRQLPGRIVGETVDGQGRRGYCLTFQTREQHIRRGKATSNICTNNALMSLRAAVYCSLVGPRGLEGVGRSCLAKAHYAAERISALEGFELVYDAPFFHEFVVRCPRPAVEVVEAVRGEGILAGVALSRFWGEREDELLVAVTEKRTRGDIDRLVEALSRVGRGA